MPGAGCAHAPKVARLTEWTKLSWPFSMAQGFVSVHLERDERPDSR